MTDSTTLSYLNLHAILGSVPRLCELDESAKSIIATSKTSISFDVHGGPLGALVFDNGKVSFVPGKKGKIKLVFATPDKFNGMINGTVTPIPRSGFLQIGFLLKKFTALTDVLGAYLRPEPEKLNDPKFFEISTRLMLNVIANAVVWVGNVDKVGKASASHITDGVIKIEIKGSDSVYIQAKDHVLTKLDHEPEHVTAFMSFDNINIARDLFDGRINALASIGLGYIRVGGMISQVDNINRILDRVSLYLA